jgi:hypothetical protein
MAKKAFAYSLALNFQTSHPSFKPFHAFREVAKLFSDAFNLCRYFHLLTAHGNKRGATSEQHSGGQGGRKISKTLLPGLHDLKQFFSLFYNAMGIAFGG